MAIKPGTFPEADKDLTALRDGWTKSLEYIPGFSYKTLEDYLEDKQIPEDKPTEAFKHNKSGHKLFKAGYPR